MLPRSCLRLADSKSNSSTRFPRSTTTRVSSGWVASMSILLAIDLSLGGASDRARPAPERRRAENLKGRTGWWVERESLGREPGCELRQERARRPGATQADLVCHIRHDRRPGMERQREEARPSSRFALAGLC